jgi:hypothetical protein
MKENKRAQEMSARIQPKHDATFRSAGRIGAASAVSGQAGGQGDDVLARRQGDRFTQHVLGDVKIERERLDVQAEEKQALPSSISDIGVIPAAPAEQVSNNPDLAGWRERLKQRSVAGARGKARFLNESKAPLLDADSLRGQLKRDPQSFAPMGDAGTVDRMLDVLTINSTVSSLRAKQVARLQQAQEGINMMWQSAKADKERDTVRSAYTWRKQYNLRMTPSQKLQLEMFMPDQERIIRDKTQRKARLQAWATLVGGKPVFDVDALQ